MTSPIDPKLLISPAVTKTPDTATNRKDPAALRKACQDFEALFVHSLFKEMRKTIPQDGLLPRGMGEDAYVEMMDWEMAQRSSRTQSLGIAEALFRQLGGEKDK